jgi:hypothetical protein
MDVEDDHPQEALESREPSVEDLVALCGELNARQARYVVVGGFAIRGAGFLRSTMAIDLLMDASEENKARVFSAMRSLPDHAVDQLETGDVSRFRVVRVADEIVVDLMESASGITYADAVGYGEIVTRTINGVEIPFASAALLWRIKRSTHREKDQLDLLFLRRLIEASGESVPDE